MGCDTVSTAKFLPTFRGILLSLSLRLWQCRLVSHPRTSPSPSYSCLMTWQQRWRHAVGYCLSVGRWLRSCGEVGRTIGFNMTASGTKTLQSKRLSRNDAFSWLARSRWNGSPHQPPSLWLFNDAVSRSEYRQTYIDAHIHTVWVPSVRHYV
jgi:hypothetical protein